MPILGNAVNSQAGPASGGGTITSALKLVSIGLVNADSIIIKAGQPITLNNTGTGIIRANAAIVGRKAIGLALSDTSVGFTVPFVDFGGFQLSDWTAITGTVTLTVPAIYYLDIASGKLTTVAPTMPGQIVQQIGYSEKSNSLIVNIEKTILL